MNTIDRIREVCDRIGDRAKPAQQKLILPAELHDDRLTEAEIAQITEAAVTVRRCAADRKFAEVCLEAQRKALELAERDVAAINARSEQATRVLAKLLGRPL